jgi:hypothetical protein
VEQGSRSAGLRFAAFAALVLLASVAFASIALAARAPAPRLSVKGTTLSWTEVQGATSYELRSSSHGAVHVTEVSGLRYTIASEAPTTSYHVRASAPVLGKWSKAARVVNRQAKGKHHKEEPEEVEREGISFSPGVVGGSEANFDFPAVASLGAKLVRIEVPFWEVNEAAIAQTSAQYEAKGITPQILYNFTGTMPSSAQATGITALARIPGIKRIEFGNETSYGYQYGDEPNDASYKQRARTYAIRFVEAAKALEPYHIGLLAQAGNGGTESPVWVNEMFAAEPELTKYVSGWTIHPYGTHGPTEMSEMLSELASHGDTSLPIDITEWGLATDNGRALSNNYGFPVNLTYAQAGALLKESVAKYRAQCDGRLRSFIVYQDRDERASGSSTDREYYFGALQHEDQRKPGYTEAVEAVMKEG